MPELMNTIMADGPSSNPSQPVKALLRAWGTWVEGIITAFLSNGGLIYDTKAHMDADLAHGANSSAWVLGDPTVANNGIYRKLGASGAGSWNRIADLPYSFIAATDAGAGTANAIVATTSIPLPSANGAALISLNIFENNTGPATVSFNGGAALTIKTNAGNDVQTNYLVAGMIVAGYVSGSTFRLISEIGTAADRAAAEAAAAASAGSAAAAAAAAATVNLPTTVANTMLVAKPDGSGYLAKVAADVRDFLDTPVYVADRASAKALDPTKDKAFIIYDEGGRNGPFIFKLTSALTAAESTAKAADTQEGIYFTNGLYTAIRQGKVFDVTVFGAVQNGVTDDSAAIQASLDVLGYANVLEWKGSTIKVNNIRLKEYGNTLQGYGWPKLISSAGVVINIEHSFQTVRGFQIDGTLQTLTVPAIMLKTGLRGLTTVTVEDIYGINCGAGIADDHNGTNKGVFINFRNMTWEGHRGGGITTYDCWASYYIVNVVFSRVGVTGASYNYNSFYINGAQGVFFLNNAVNGSAGTSIQPQQDGAFFDNCGFVVFDNFIPDHVGGRGMVFNACINVRGGRSTIVNCVDHGFVVVGGSYYSIEDVHCSQLAAVGLASKDGFSLSGAVNTFRATGLAAKGFTRDGFHADVCARLNVSGDFSSNAGRGIVTTGAGTVNLFHGCLTAGNTAGNYSLSSATDFLRDHIVNAGTIGDATGPATA
ncbi:hypothetical protein [Mesorhizobium sp. B2-6-1]|uniref:hypothetical protein n=1 Tax=Mesorhizobium sp. B2-6-1 TaxID=2589916 RepID=UPI001127C449|nr:hypothetical protein [Mesorhizobium sp. B2-6-1]TPJ60816.1 hypothetical protein FJ443_19950 [Mesorhizobium sp. B2-6-1]